jgi:hypothetical protein
MANEAPELYTSSSWYESTAFGGFDVSPGFEVGHLTVDGDSYSKGALRFDSVDLNRNDSLNYADLFILCSGGSGAHGNIKLKTWGVKEGNPDGGYPFGRTKTTASNTSDQSFPGVGSYFQIGVTSILQEIINQAAYSRLNSVEFLIEDNGGALGAFIDGAVGGSDTFLVYRRDAEPNFLPTAKSTSAGSLPSTSDVGIMIAKPGVNVFTATDEELYFTTRKNQMKVAVEGSVTCVANVEMLIPHNLGYKPQAIAYAQGGGKSFKLPRFFASATDPIGGGLEGDIRVDSTYLRITVFQNSDVYYYIFLDEQPT